VFKLKEFVEAHKFLAPYAIHNNSDELQLVHFKNQWQSIQVGHNTEKIRFTLVKLIHPDVETTNIEGISTINWVMDIPENYKIVDKVDNDKFKGIKLKLNDLNEPSNDGWNMT